jgi:hypothetical protein
MKKIFAKLKNDQNVIVFPDAEIEALENIYAIPKIVTAVPFQVENRILLEGEWYFIVLTEEQKEEMLGGYVSEADGLVLDTIIPEQYTEVKVLYSVSGEDKLFTKITSRHVQQGSRYIVLEEKPKVVEQGNALLFTGEVDAYWTGTRLYFKKFTVARSLFPGIQKVYKEATEEEANEFLSSNLFTLKDEMSSDFISLRNRKRIADIIEAEVIDLKDPEVCKNYLIYAKQYELDLEIEDDKISLIDNSDVEKVINLLGESFYTTDVTGEKREIRTSKKLVHGKRKRAK